MPTTLLTVDPTTKGVQPPFNEKQQVAPGSDAEMKQKADHGELSYKGSGKLAGKTAIITGGDSGIGRAVAIAFAREGADLVISYLNEDEDAKETAKWIEKAGRRVILLSGDISEEKQCQLIIQTAVKEFGKLDILVNNAAHQKSEENITEITAEEWDKTMKTNVYAMFYLIKAAVPYLPKGGSIINTSSINADSPSPSLLAYATTKGAIANFSAGLAQSLAKQGIRVNAVAPGPIWTPLIVSTMPAEKVKTFGSQVPFKRPGQPAELAPIYVLLASEDSSYISGALIPVTGGKPIL